MVYGIRKIASRVEASHLQVLDEKTTFTALFGTSCLDKVQVEGG
jgi:hypothetical protein